MLAPLLNTILPHIGSGMLRRLLQTQDAWRALRAKPNASAWPKGMEDERDLFFVKIGANRAEINDPIIRQIILRGWRGILVEPQLEPLANLKQTLQYFPGLVFENIAVAEQPGEKDFFFIEKTSGTPTWIHQVSSLKAEVTSKVATYLPHASINKTSIPCTTLNLLLEKHQVQNFDALLIDTEGYDAKVLQSFDLDRYRPRLICYEHFHLNPDEKVDTEKHLQKYGYRIQEQGYDTVAVLD